MTIYFPSSLIVIVSFIGFWIDPLSVPGRVTLTVTSLLAIMTQFISVRSPLSDVNYVTAIDIWFIGCIFLVSLAMLEFASYHFITFRKSHRITRVVSYNNYHDLDHSGTEKNRFPISRHWMTQLVNSISNKNFDVFSRVFSPSIFFLYSSAYWILMIHYSNKRFDI